MIKGFEDTVQSKPFTIRTQRTSPKLFPDLKESERLQIGKEFKHLIDQEELEMDLVKLKLSKYLLLRDAIIDS